MSGMTLGLVGLPNAGKSTLFNALTRGAAQVANYPFCTIDPNVGVVPIPDRRLEALAATIRPDVVTPGTLKVVDIAGLVEGAHRGEGLGNRFLAHIREVDAILHVVRCFDDPNIAHVAGEPDPRRDVETVETELLLADLDTVMGRLETSRRRAKSGDPARAKEVEALERLQDRLERGLPARPLRSDPLSPDEEQLAAELFLLTRKPVLYVANVGEDEGAARPRVEALEKLAASRDAAVVTLAGKLEADLATLDDDEASLFRDEMNIGEEGLVQVLQAGMALLQLITFYTSVRGTEIRAWIIPEGTEAPTAAGRIHTDMERGFIRAEVIPWQTLIETGSFQAARAAGLVRSEGRDYTVQDGDVILFRFNV